GGGGQGAGGRGGRGGGGGGRRGGGAAPAAGDGRGGAGRVGRGSPPGAGAAHTPPRASGSASRSPSRPSAHRSKRCGPCRSRPGGRAAPGDAASGLRPDIESDA